jgi:putative phage-type endonuclease
VIILNCEQCSPEWFQARVGIPSASKFDKLITPTGKASTQAETYRRELLAEWVTGEKTKLYQNEWMLRGIELEPEARDYYQFATGKEVQQIGLAYLDERKLVSCSPDGLLDDGGVEIKCPAPGTHVSYLLDNKIPTGYIPQVQGSMYICEREWWDFVSYCPGIEPMTIRVKRDEKWIAAFKPILDSFIDNMLEEREILIERLCL